MERDAKLRRLLYKSPLWFGKSVYIHKIPKRLRRFWCGLGEKQKTSSDIEGNYLQYKLIGIMNLKLIENSNFEIENSHYIKAIKLNNDLTKIIVYLKDRISYPENKLEIDSFVKQIIFNLIAQTEADIAYPIWYNEYIYENGKRQACEYFALQENMIAIRRYHAEDIYKLVTQTPTAISTHALLYDRILGILQKASLTYQDRLKLFCV